MVAGSRKWLVLAMFGLVVTPTWGADLRLKLKKPAKETAPASATPAAAPQWSDAVAEINGQPITREELALELIEIHGQEILDQLINRRLVEVACQKKNVEITRSEIEDEINQRVKKLNISRKEFFDQVMAKVGKSHTQYIRDTIWPALALQKLVADDVRITEEELKQAFESHFGEKVDVRMLVVLELRRAQELWKKTIDEPDPAQRLELFEGFCKTFSMDAHTQPLGGKTIISRHTTAPEIEQAAFALKPGELSKIIQFPQGNLMLLCVEHIPARQDIAMDTVYNEETKETVRDALYAAIKVRNTRVAVEKYFSELRKTAKINNYLSGEFDADAVQPAGAVVPETEPAKR